jgi:HemY protein
VSFVALYLGLQFLNYMRRLPASVRAYKRAQRRKKGHEALLAGLHALTDGRYEAAEKSAARALELGEDAGLSALVAARAAHKLKRREQRDRYFAEAERLAPQDATARLLSQAELLLDDRLYNEALAVLRKLQSLEADYAPALRLELKIQLRLENWEQVLVLLKRLEKTAEIETWQAEEVRLQAHQHLLRRLDGDLPALQEYWRNMSVQERLNSRLAYQAALALIRLGAQDEAAQIVEASLEKQWNSQLAGLLGDCLGSNPQRQLQQAERWLLSHEGDASLLLALGNMCARLQLWGKAQSYLEASISVHPSAEAHFTLAKLLEDRGEAEAASRHFRRSAELFSATV